ncbi:MAG TPA: DUF4301 family protein [Thermoanaerobaculia bacterium]|nr:DUF4301 family protein [Thermoanaerobaculia bacterium]
MPTDLSPRDRAAIEAHGLTVAEVERQLALLRRPPARLRLVRPATAGDGVRRVPAAEHAALLALADEAARAGRLTKFVPASGAASRMFAFLAPGSPETPEKRIFSESVDAFAFAGDLDFDRLAATPKGLLPFHVYPDGPRTAFEEHLYEAAATVRDVSGLCRVHFTVSPLHRSAFEETLGEVRERVERATGARFEVSFSEQAPSSDTIAADLAGGPFRTSAGSLLFRPGGHGALLPNLGALARAGADVVLVKNIDNVVPDARRGPTLLWKRLLTGLLVKLERSSRRERPIRVAGVVRNEGEPGGGPFWVAGPRGPSLQIVESAEVDTRDPAQAALWKSATHFNPVDLVCSLRDVGGRPFDLPLFVDEEAVFVAEKFHEGKPLKALERPGLWNGAMALWETCFVEVPKETFAPVKTALDLLRPDHRA